MPGNRPVAVILLGFMLNPRFQKRIDLEKQFYDLHLICWDRGKDMIELIAGDDYHTHVIKVDAVDDPLKRIKPYRQFSLKAKQMIKEIQPQMIHVQGLDMLRIAMAYKKKYANNTRIIYEVADLHRLLVDKQKNPLRIASQMYLKSQDRKLCKEIDLLIVTSEKYVESYFSRIVSDDKILVFPNVPNLEAFKSYQKKEHRDPLTVGFIGGVRYKKQIKNLLFVAQRLDINVLIAGFESGENEIEKICENMSNVEWYGKFDFKTQAAGLYGKCDIIYSVYDADMANVRVALPNKLYESIYCELPILVAKNTFLAELVEKWGVGMAVDYKDPDDLESVLQDFQKNSGLFEQIEKQCKKYKNICDLRYYDEKLRKIILSWMN